MQERSPKWLEDILGAAAYIGEITDGQTLQSYGAHRMLRHAVERNFEIIGEALTRLASTDPDPDTAARIAKVPQIIAFRNVLIHGYDLVDHSLVWSTARTQVPGLLREVAAILRALPPRPR